MSAIKEHYHHQIEAATRPTARPILFSSDMVRAILDGRKTQTRRLVKYGDIKTYPEWFAAIYPDGGGNWVAWSRDMPGTAEFTKKAYPNGEGFLCPYGHPGDHLWVRETWAEFAGIEFKTEYIYRADSIYDTPAKEPLSGHRWRPSIHMPRAAARIHLHITDIRAQRLHDITEADAIAEGFAKICKDGQTWKFGIPDTDGYPGGRGWPWQHWDRSPIKAYQTLWEKINGPGSWDTNPWVWVIQFNKM